MLTPVNNYKLWLYERRDALDIDSLKVTSRNTGGTCEEVARGSPLMDRTWLCPGLRSKLLKIFVAVLLVKWLHRHSSQQYGLKWRAFIVVKWQKHLWPLRNVTSTLVQGKTLMTEYARQKKRTIMATKTCPKLIIKESERGGGNSPSP